MEDGLDEDIEFGDEISDNDEDDVDNVSFCIQLSLEVIYCRNLYLIFLSFM